MEEAGCMEEAGVYGEGRVRKARWRGECGGEEKAAAQCTEAEGWAYQAGTRALGRLAGLLGKCGGGGTASDSERLQLAHWRSETREKREALPWQPARCAASGFVPQRIYRHTPGAADTLRRGYHLMWPREV